MAKIQVTVGWGVGEIQSTDLEEKPQVQFSGIRRLKNTGKVGNLVSPLGLFVSPNQEAF